MKERSYLFDNMKAVLIFLVVVGHFLSRGETEITQLKTLYCFIYSFHMPAFVFVTGYFSKNVAKCRDTAVEKFLVPYAVFTVLLYIEKVILFHDIGGVGTFSVLRPSWGLWYFMALFFWKILLKDMVKVRFMLPFSIIIGLGAGLTREFGNMFAMGRVASLLFFFLLGYYCEEKHIEKIRKLPKVCGVAIVGVTGGLAFFMNEVVGVKREVLLMRKAYNDGEELHQMLLRLLVYVIAFFMIVAIINLSSDKKQWFSYIGENSICIYVLHLFVVRIEERYSFFPRNFYAYLIVTLLVSFILCVLCARPNVKKVYEFLIDKINQLIFHMTGQKESIGSEL